MCIEIFFFLKQVILLLQANENKVSRRGRSNCEREGDRESRREREKETGRARFLDKLLRHFFTSRGKQQLGGQEFESHAFLLPKSGRE